MRLLPLIRELFIVDKARGIVRFGDVMNYAQVELIQTCERQLAQDGTIRIIVLKARQIGISTAIEAVMFALAIILDNFKGLIVSHETDSAQHILGMTHTYWDTFIFRDRYQDKYNGLANLAWTTGSGLHVKTAKNVKGGRSNTIQALHASEAAFYDKPEKLMTGLRSAIPNFGLTAIFIESTANGIGNYFHTMWMGAVSNRNEFTPLFFPWHKHPEYVAQFIPKAQHSMYAILGELDDEEKLLTSRGIPPERLMWRRWAIANLSQGDLQKFHQEYPFNPAEAFLSTGRNVFSVTRLIAHYNPWLGKTGRLVQVGQKVQFVEDRSGPLTIFSHPAKERDWGIYLIGADPTHTTAGDYACAQVINRRTLKQCAVYRRKTDPITFADDLYLLGAYYNQAMIAPEKTGPGYATVGTLLGRNYPNVWESVKLDRTPGFINHDTFGWGTNKATKHAAISAIVKCLADPLQQIGRTQYGLVIHDAQTIDEMQHYVTTEDGQGYQNADGSEYDDGVMAMGIALAVHFIEPPPPPWEEREPDHANTPVKLAQPATPEPTVTHEDPTRPEWEEWEQEEEGIPA